MSLQEIFDPIVKACFKKKYGGGSGGEAGSPVVVEALCNASAASLRFPMYDLRDSMGTILFLMSEKVPTCDELSRNLFFRYDSQYHYLLRKSGDVTWVTEEGEDMPGMITLSNNGNPYFVSFTEDVAAMLSEMVGVEIGPGLYATDSAFNTYGGFVLIYNI